MEHMDKITNIDIENRRVTLQAGARVSQVVEALRPHGLTLQNFASITEQQIGGFTQVSAHGTGAGIPPVDEQVLSIKLVTPAAGVLELSADDDDPSLFQLARASLGMLGVVAELTLQCVPAHKLVERTFVLSRAEVMGRHDELMKENKHLRYLWIPHTDAVVVVTCNPAPEAGFVAADKVSHAERLEPVRKLLRSHPDCKLTREQINELQFTSLRDELLALSPLDVSWVKRVNEAEAEVWRRSEGTRIDWSDQILQFDCGGQQWVCEVCLPVPDSVDAHVDIRYMYNLLDMIDRENVPAHAPIEQRWSAPSFSPMSPAAERPDRDLAKLYSWVGIIMYLPDAEVNAVAREAITKAFRGYKRLCERNLWQDARAVEHWAKIEMPGSEEEKALLQLRTYQKYPVDGFKAVCNIFDPHGILRNDLTETILGIS